MALMVGTRPGWKGLQTEWVMREGRQDALTSLVKGKERAVLDRAKDRLGAARTEKGALS